VRILFWAGWPVGLVLILAHSLGGVLTKPVFAVVIALYAAAVLLAVRALGGFADRTAAAWFLAGPGIFVLAGLTGPPTADAPTPMLLNAVVLLAAAAVLMAGAVHVRERINGGAGHVREHIDGRAVHVREHIDGGAGRAPAALAVVGLAIGSALYLANLLARWAVVRSGAAGAQAAVEDRAWMAAEYLRGLDGEPAPLTVLLVWWDMSQLAYLVLTYLAFAGLAVALGRAGAIPARRARAIAACGIGLAATVTASAALAADLPGAAGTVAGWTAFVLTIPFMSTLPAYLLGGAMISTRRAAGAPARPAVEAAGTPGRFT
jgi:hypothetical protein